jgi:hypothetical protein
MRLFLYAADGSWVTTHAEARVSPPSPLAGRSLPTFTTHEQHPHHDPFVQTPVSLILMECPAQGVYNRRPVHLSMKDVAIRPPLLQILADHRSNRSSALLPSNRLNSNEGFVSQNDLKIKVIAPSTPSAQSPRPGRLYQILPWRPLRPLREAHFGLIFLIIAKFQICLVRFLRRAAFGVVRCKRFRELNATFH